MVTPTVEAGTLLFQRYRVVEVLSLGFGSVVVRCIVDDDAAAEKRILKVVSLTRGDPAGGALLWYLCRPFQDPLSPFICQYEAILRDDGLFGLVMPALDGAILQQNPVKEFAKQLRLITQLALALFDCHDAGYLHGAIEPKNLFVQQSGELKLLGAGIGAGVATIFPGDRQAEVVSDNFERREGARRQVERMMSLPPEVLRGAPYDGAAERYAWGVCAYYVLSGVWPWNATFPLDLVQEKERTPIPLLERNRELPQVLGELIDSCIHQEPSKRPPSLEVILEGLSPFLCSPDSEAEVARCHAIQTTSPERRIRSILDYPRKFGIDFVWRLKRGLIARFDESVVRCLDIVGAFVLLLLTPLRVLWQGFTQQPLLGVVAITAIGGLALAISVMQPVSPALPGPESKEHMVDASAPQGEPTPTPSRSPFAALPVATDLESVSIEGALRLPTALAFVAQRDGHAKILLIDSVDRVVRSLHDVRGVVTGLSWSPDGGQLAYLVESSGMRELRIVHWKSGELRLVISDPRPKSSPVWGARGERIMYLVELPQVQGGARATVIESIDLVTGRSEQVSARTGQQSALSVPGDGSALYYGTDRFWPGGDICRYSFTTGTEDCLFSGTVDYARPRISSDGSRMVYVVYGPDSEQRAELVHLKGGDPKQTFFFGSRMIDFAIAPDQKTVAFASRPEEEHAIFQYDLAESVSTVARGSVDLRYPEWFPQLLETVAPEPEPGPWNPVQFED